MRWLIRTRDGEVTGARSTTRRRRALTASLLSSLLLSACQAASSRTPLLHGTPWSATPGGTSTPEAPLDGCPAPQTLASLVVLAKTDLRPDDLLGVSDGTLWVGDPAGGRLEHLAADGKVLATVIDTEAPEGMVAAGTSIVLAEQTANRLVAFVPPSAARRTVLTLPARGAREGVDGIGVVGRRLLVPDSAHGTLVSANVDGTSVTTLATGLGRDVGAQIGPDGALWVAVEGARGLWRVAPQGGPATAIGGPQLADADDVVATGSLLYVTLLSAGEVAAVDPGTGADRILVTGAPSPQGLAVLANGTLVVADSARRVIAAVPECAAA